MKRIAIKMKQKKFQLAILFFPAFFALAILPSIVFAQTTSCNQYAASEPECSASGGAWDWRALGGEGKGGCPANVGNQQPNGTANTPANVGNQTPNSSGNSLCDKSKGFDDSTGLCLPVSQFKTGIAGSTSLTDLIGKVLKILLYVA